jgi:hypothetical protein
MSSNNQSRQQSPKGRGEPKSSRANGSRKHYTPQEQKQLLEDALQAVERLCKLRSQIREWPSGKPSRLQPDYEQRVAQQAACRSVSLRESE